MDSNKFTTKVKDLLSKTTNIDKDERYMAISDLISLLESYDGILDVSLQANVRDAIVLALDDKSADVQTIAVSCLSTLVKKFEQNKIVEIGEKLGNKLLEGIFELRDIYAMGLKTLINSLPKEFGTTFGVKIVTLILDGLKKNTANPEDTAQLHIICLDLSKDLIIRFGSVLPAEKIDNLLNILLSSIATIEKVELRKRFSSTLSCIASILSDKSFKMLMQTLIANIEEAGKKSKTSLLYIYIQTIGGISRNAGARVGSYLQQIIPLLSHFCDISSMQKFGSDSKAMEMAQELVENCLQAFEAIIGKCPNEVVPFLTQLSTISLKYLEYDPNYTYEDIAQMQEDQTDDGWGDDAGWNDDVAEFNVGANDDDDSSWKVRRAACRVIGAFVKGKDEILQQFYEIIIKALISRFKERISSVKIEILSAFKEMLGPVSHVSNFNSNSMDVSEPEPSKFIRSASSVRASSYYDILSGYKTEIITQLKTQYDSGDVKIRAVILSVMLLFIQLFHSTLNENYSKIMALLISTLSEKDNAIRVAGLSIMSSVYSLGASVSLSEFNNSIVPNLISSINDSYPKVSGEALRLAPHFVRTLSDKNDAAIILAIFDACYNQLALKDVGQEIKDSSLFSVSNIIAAFPNFFQSQLPKVLNLFIERLKNEVTRISALKAISVITLNCNCDNWKDTGSSIEIILQECAALLKKNSQALKLEAIIALNSIISAYAKDINAAALKTIITEISTLLRDEDLQLAHLSIKLISTTVEKSPKLLETVHSEAFPKLLMLLKSPLLQGDGLNSVISLFQHLLASNYAPLNYDILLNNLMALALNDIPKQSAQSVSQCISGLVLCSNEKVIAETSSKFVNNLTSSVNFKELRISILVLSEIGRVVDLSHDKSLDLKFFNLLINENDEIKQSSAAAIGSIAVGNFEFFLPLLLKRLSTMPDKCYLLLTAFKEFLVQLLRSDKVLRVISSYKLSEKVLPILLENSENSDEGVRQMVSECLGKLAAIDSDVYSVIKDRLVTSSPFIRATMVTALKYSLSKTSGISSHFSTLYPTFVQLLKDLDINVRRQAFLTLNAIIYSAFNLVKNNMHEILLLINAESKPHEELVREINLGPITRRIDDGFPLRKAAYQCLDTIIDTSNCGVLLEDVFPNIQNGIEDAETDIQILSYQILLKVANNRGSHFLEMADSLTESIKKNIIARLKDSKDPDPEKHFDVMRAAVRSLYFIRNIHGCESTPNFFPFYKRVLETQALKDILAQIKKVEGDTSA